MNNRKKHTLRYFLTPSCTVGNTAGAGRHKLLTGNMSGVLSAFWVLAHLSYHGDNTGRGQDAHLPGWSDICGAANNKWVYLCHTSLIEKHWCWSCVLLPLCHRAAPWAMWAASYHLEAQLHTNVTNLSSIQDTFCILKFQSVKFIRCWYICV